MSCTKASIYKNIKKFSTYISLQDEHTASAILCVTDRADIQPRPQPKPVLTNLACHLVSHFNGFSTPVIHVNTWIITHLPTPEG